MKRTLSICILTVFILAACELFSPTTQETIVGDWAMQGSIMMSFSESGTMTIGASVYQYSASDGAGEYWMGTSLKVPFTYSISGNQLSFTIMNEGSGVTMILTRM